MLCSDYLPRKWRSIVAKIAQNEHIEPVKLISSYNSGNHVTVDIKHNIK